MLSNRLLHLLEHTQNVCISKKYSYIDWLNVFDKLKYSTIIYQDDKKNIYRLITLWSCEIGKVAVRKSVMLQSDGTTTVQ